MLNIVAASLKSSDRCFDFAKELYRSCLVSPELDTI